MSSSGRFYFQDLDTGTELDHELNGSAYEGCGPWVQDAAGEYVPGYRTEVFVFTFATRAQLAAGAQRTRRVTCDDFGGKPVRVKFWAPNPDVRETFVLVPEGFEPPAERAAFVQRSAISEAHAQGTAKLEAEAAAVVPPAKPNDQHLPTIVRFEGVTDSGEYGNATCPHCGADGRYVWTFTCDDGKVHGAMAGCIKLFPVSKLAEEHRRILDRAKSREAEGGKLASWDVVKLDAIDAVAAGTMTPGEALAVVQCQNAKRQAWMDRRR